MLISKNVNNDVSKDSPILLRAFLDKLFSVGLQQQELN